MRAIGNAFKILIILAIGMALLAMLTGGALWQAFSDMPSIHITVNGQELSFEGSDFFGDSLSALAICVLAGVVICIALPLVLLLSLGLPLLILGLVLGAVLLGALSLGSLLASPALVMLLLLWLLLRSPKKAPPPARPANPTKAG
ncbi:MAG: hypothetical protein K2W93_05735 [Burkholderiaceae bacterium]|nr:hypothetical protein [Burkholderiaceae bacterium]